jgi:hypothetical protein
VLGFRRVFTVNSDDQPQTIHTYFSQLRFLSSIASFLLFVFKPLDQQCLGKQPVHCEKSYKLPTCIHLLTPWSRVLLEKLTGFAASQQIPRIYGTRKFITVLTSTRHLSLSWARSIQSPPPPPTSWRSFLILSSHLRLGVPIGLFTSGFPTKTLCTSTLPHTRHMPSSSHPSWFYHPHNIG